jgi:hypothetical protein
MAHALRAFYEPIPEYMQRLSMMGARFVVGNDGTGAAGGSDGGSGGDGGSSNDSGSGKPAGKGNGDGEQPPWGSDDEFDPQTAWQLIKNLRGDNEKLKNERDKALGDLGAKDSEIEELRGTVQLTDDTVQAKDKEIAELTELRTKEGLLYDAGLDRKYVSQVVGDDEDAWQASIKNLLDLRAQGAQDGAPNPAQAAGQQSTEPSLDEAANEFFGFTN